MAKLVATLGHDNTHTVVVVGLNSKDRAQIVQVGPTQTCPKRSPSQTCELIVKKMAKMVSEMPLPVKGSEGVQKLRDTAQKLRDNLMTAK